MVGWCCIFYTMVYCTYFARTCWVRWRWRSGFFCKFWFVHFMFFDGFVLLLFPKEWNARGSTQWTKSCWDWLYKKQVNDQFFQTFSQFCTRSEDHFQVRTAQSWGSMGVTGWRELYQRLLPKQQVTSFEVVHYFQFWVVGGLKRVWNFVVSDRFCVWTKSQGSCVPFVFLSMISSDVKKAEVGSFFPPDSSSNAVMWS